jgi:hypothetical protein
VKERRFYPMLYIVYKNGLSDNIPKTDYDEFNYDGKVVTIFKNGSMIALINVDSISGIYLKDETEVKN